MLIGAHVCAKGGAMVARAARRTTHRASGILVAGPAHRFVGGGFDHLKHAQAFLNAELFWGACDYHFLFY